MRTIRVFPRRTKATPDDDLAYVGYPDLFAQADRVMISVAFSWDIPEAERLAKAWKHVAPVEIGGPAYNSPGGEFIPGMYLKKGYTITSRGCINRCWFCSVWKRESGITELPIKDGWIIQDDNLLACSEQHIRDVFAMLKRQPAKAEFTGGLEAKLLQPWHVELLHDLKPRRLYFAYDTPDDYEPLVYASKLMAEKFRVRSHNVCCYVLIGYPKDTMTDAETRLRRVTRMGLTPYAMLWRDRHGKVDPDWKKFQRLWVRPEIIWKRTTGG